MSAKFFVILSLAITAWAVALVPEEAPAHYEFEYSVHDDHSGDMKQQRESRNGDVVQGFYSLVQPDGVLRVVDYASDAEHGFTANVRYEGNPAPAPATAHQPYAAPVAKLSYAAPIAKVAHAIPIAKVAYAVPVAKIAYAAPVTKVAYAAPVAKVAYAAPAAPVHKLAYTESHGHVSFSSPHASYHH